MRPSGFLAATAAGPDPIAAPGDITDRMIINLPCSVPGAGGIHPADRTVLFTKGAAGNVVGQMYVLDESTAALAAADRVWRKIGDAMTIPVDTAVDLSTTHGAAVYSIMVHGKVYFRVTSGHGAAVVVGFAVL